MRKVLSAAFLMLGLCTVIASAGTPPALAGNMPSAPATDKSLAPESRAANNGSSQKQKGTMQCDFVEEDTAASAPDTAPVVTPPEAATPALTAKPATDPRVSSKENLFIAPLDWSADGAVMGNEKHSLLMSAGDRIFVTVGSDKVQPGMRCAVYRCNGKAKDPETREIVGYEMIRIGLLEVTADISEKVATATVLISSDPIEVGDQVKVLVNEN